jgi:exosome complex RNA-binding protein Csl4
MPIDSSKATASDLTIRGNVQLIEGKFYFIRDTTGHEVRLHVNSETKSEDRIKVGDKIEAKVTSEEHAMSIRLQIPQSSTAPPLPNTSPISPSPVPAVGVAQ